MPNTQKSGQTLRSKKHPHPIPRSGRGSRINSNTSYQIQARVIEATAPCQFVEASQHKLQFLASTSQRHHRRTETPPARPDFAAFGFPLPGGVSCGQAAISNLSRFTLV